MTLVQSPRLFEFGKPFQDGWFRHWPNTICADPEQIEQEPSPRRTQNIVFCGTNAMGGGGLFICLQQSPTIAFPNRLTYVETRPPHDNLSHIGCVPCFEMLAKTFFQQNGNIK